MKIIHYSKAAGKKVEKLYHTWKEVKNFKPTVIPGKKFLFNFQLGSYLILDGYGNETVPESFGRRIFGTHYSKLTVAINTETGEVMQTAFYLCEKEGYSALVTPIIPQYRSGVENLLVPKSYLPRLKELFSEKRPYRITFNPGLLMLLLEREASFTDLREQVNIELRFQNETLRLLTNYSTVEKDVDEKY